jgi:hypothetical protein
MFRASPHAQVAQLVEQRIENPRVGGSIPPLGTIGNLGTEVTLAEALWVSSWVSEALD